MLFLLQLEYNSNSDKNKVEKATEIYNKFFSDDKSHDINNYIHKEVL